MIRHSLKHLSLLVLFFAPLTGCATVSNTLPLESISAKIGDESHLNYYGWVSLGDQGLKESGITLRFPLTVNGFKDTNMLIALYLDRILPFYFPDNVPELLGVYSARSPYEGSIWKAYELFIPYRKFKSFPAKFQLIVDAVIQLEGTDKFLYLDRKNFQFDDYIGPIIIWDLIGGRSDESLTDESLAFQFKFQAYPREYVTGRFQPVLIVHDSEGQPFKNSAGETIQFESSEVMVTGASFEHTFSITKSDWETKLRIPDGTMNSLRVGAIEKTNGTKKLCLGNIAINTFYGGPVNFLIQDHQKEITNLQRDIDFFQKQLEILNPS